MTAQQLRKSILQMAVQGKLVPQDPSDEPAHILLERIRAEKERLIKEKKIKKEKNPSVIYRGTDNLHYEKFADGMVKCIEDEIPFEIPESWGWGRLGELVYNHGQRRPSADFSYIDISSIDNQHQRLSCEENILSSEKAPSRARKIVAYGDILYSTVRPYLHNMCIIDRIFSKQPIASTGFAVLTCHDDFFNEFLFYYMMSPDFDTYVNHTDNAKGVAYPSISDTRLYHALIPIPPAREQRDIVSAVKRLIHYINKYNIARNQLNRLMSNFPNAMKHSIIQWAVQGKLVQQDENDEPASLLLEQVRTEKEELIKQGKIKRNKKDSIIYRGEDNSYYERFADGSEKCIDEEIPFEIPKGWAWTHLSDITQILNGDRGQNYPAKNKLITKGVPFVSASNIESGVVSSNNLLCMTEEQYDALRAGKLIDNDIVYCIRGSLGKCGVFTMSKGAIASSLAIIRPFHTLYILREYLFLYLNSPLARSEIQKYDNGSAQPNLAAKDLMNFLVPLPPPMEAKMIVQKVKNIFTRVEGINAASM